MRHSGSKILLGTKRDIELYQQKTALANSPPTQEDLNNLRGLLGGFRIVDIEIPKFDTKQEMEIWRDRTVKNALAEC
jgi:hypothetical protein